MRLTLPKTAPGKRWRTYMPDRKRREVVKWHQRQRNKAIRRMTPHEEGHDESHVSWNED